MSDFVSVKGELETNYIRKWCVLFHYLRESIERGFSNCGMSDQPMSPQPIHRQYVNDGLCDVMTYSSGN